MYYRNANIFLLVFDLSRPETLKDCDEWLKNIRDNCAETEYEIIMIGNKSDLEKTEDII